MPVCYKLRKEGAFTRVNDTCTIALAGEKVIAGYENTICKAFASASLLNGAEVQASDVATYMSSTSFVVRPDLAVVILSFKLAHAFTVMVAGA